MAPAVLILADPGNANVEALKVKLPALEIAGAGNICIGTDIDALKAFDFLSEVEVIVVGIFLGGKPCALRDLQQLCPKVRWVHSLSAGVDTLTPVLKELPNLQGVPLTNAKGAFSSSLAEYALAAMLHFNKQVPRLQMNRASKTWDKFTMNELHGQTVGFIGFGDIAQTTAHLCRAFGMNVIACRNSRGRSGDELADEVIYSSEKADAFVEIFRRADHVVCTLPGGAGTRHACGAEQFAAMKPSATFISLGRGSVVDEAALLAVLRDRKIAGAALDVFDVEPLPQDSSLWECDNLLISPHNADWTADYFGSTWDTFVQKFKVFSEPSFKGFSDTVDLQLGY